MKRYNQKGYLMLMTIIMGAVFLGIITALATASGSNLRAARTSLAGLSALSVAEAGAENAIFNLNQDNSYTGTNTSCPISTSGSNPTTLFSDSIKGRGTFETCIADGTIANEKIVYATGKIYLPANATKPISVRRIRLVLIGTFSGSYGVQTGPGGLILRNSAAIVNGDVYVGGKITMSNSATIGSAANPLNVWAGHYSCPQPPTAAFPILCGAGTDPISISNQAHIYGNVRANNQSNASGMSSPGLTATSGVANSTLPDYDRDAHKASVASTMSASAASCSHSESRTWPANVHITGGNVTIANNCVVTVQGNVWVDGNITIANRGIIKLADGITTPPTIMIDGSGGFTLGNQTSLSSNSGAIGMTFITFWANSGCSPDCEDLTGTGLANSQNVTTINIGNQGLGAGSVLYARWSKVYVGNPGSIGQVLGQTIEFANTGNITFGSASAPTSTYSYAVRYYEQI